MATNIKNENTLKAKQASIEKTLEFLKKATADMPCPLMPRVINKYGRKPFLILIACLLSLRTRDTVTWVASQKLFDVAQTPQEILNLSDSKLYSLIKSVNYDKHKVQVLKHVSAEILNKFNGKVPRDRKELESIKGVGPKTSALVLGQAFGEPAICVDTHVQKISNKLGWVNTKTPKETEQALEKLIPKSQWNEVNLLLVTWGQNCKKLPPKF